MCEGMLDHKKRRKALHTVMNQVPPESELHTFLKERSDTLVAIPAHADGEDSYVAFRDRLGMVVELSKEIHKVFVEVPALECKIRELRHLKEVLKSFKKDLQTGLFDLSHLRCGATEHWGGDGLIVTNQLDHPERQGHVLVVHPEAAVLVWLVNRLKLICSPFINYSNKAGFYASIGLAANRFIETKAAEGAGFSVKSCCVSVIEEVLKDFEQMHTELLHQMPASQGTDEVITSTVKPIGLSA